MIASLPRSYLYVPADAPDKLAKSLDRGADALILDLEDAVPVKGKDEARAAISDWLRSGVGDRRTQIWVRINSGPGRLDDLRALAGLPAVTGFVLAKVEDAAEVRAIGDLLAGFEDHTSLLMPLIESATAVVNCAAIAAQPRVQQLQIGEVDLAGDLGIDPGEDEHELASIRMAIVLASAAAGISPPVGPVSRITNDAEALGRSTDRVRRLGFVGRACIHPAQIPVVHDAFTPTEEEVLDAELICRLYDEAQDRGQGVLLDQQGRLIDVAVLRAARKIIALSQHPDSCPDNGGRIERGNDSGSGPAPHSSPPQSVGSNTGCTFT